MLFEQQNRKLKTIMFVPAPHGPETAFLEMKQCVDALSSERLWCNTAGIRSFEPLAPPTRLYCRLLPPREIAKLLLGKRIAVRGGGDRTDKLLNKACALKALQLPMLSNWNKRNRIRRIGARVLFERCTPIFEIGASTTQLELREVMMEYQRRSARAGCFAAISIDPRENFHVASGNFWNRLLAIGPFQTSLSCDEAVDVGLAGDVWRSWLARNKSVVKEIVECFDQEGERVQVRLSNPMNRNEGRSAGGRFGPVPFSAELAQSVRRTVCLWCLCQIESPVLGPASPHA
jgi:hypothetical protein